MKLRMFAGAAFVAFLALAAFLLPAAPMAAQGTTTAAVSGTVTDPEGNPIESITVTVTNESTGIVNGAVTAWDGDYLVPGLQIGGPYVVEAGGLGFANHAERIERLSLGQRLGLDLILEPEAIQMETIAAVFDPTASQLIHPSRTGAEQLITERQLSTYPTISNNFTDAIQLSPLVGTGAGGTSVAAQNIRFNNIQIDGQIVQDIFGIAATGQPGGQADARSITMGAVKEYQVLVAPFDIRQSGFTGGLINAVTKTGTNEWTGSASVSYKNQDFVRDEIRIGTGDVKIGEFKNRLMAFNVGGPIVEDRAHFFAAVEIEDEERPSGGVAIGRESVQQVGINEADAARFASLLTAKGVTPEAIGEWTTENPNRNVFGRVDVQVTPNHSLTVRDNWVRAESDNVNSRGSFGNYSFQSNGYFFESETNALVAQLNSSFGGTMYNELRAGWTRIRDRRTPRSTFPQIDVTVTNPNGGTRTLVAGSEINSQGNELDQDSYEITNDFSFDAGEHRVTLGFHDEYFKFRNLFAQRVIGQWNFASLDDFENENPNQFRRLFPNPEVGELDVRPEVNTIGLYGQTEYTGIDNVVVTAGLRYDVPFVLEDPVDNPAVTTAFPGRTTSESASGNGILSPRLGLNWDVNGDQSLQVRGGVGIFTGRFPYVWLSNIFGNTGLASILLDCRPAPGRGVPDFTLDPNQPEECATGGPPSPATTPQVINLMDPDFEYPHTWKIDLAVDKTLPFGIVGTAEFLYTMAAQQIFIRELNVDFEDPVSVTQGGRQVFGTHREGVQASSVNTNSIATPNRISSSFAQVLELTNSDEDRSWSLVLQAQKRYSNEIDLNASYTLSEAKDVSSLTSSIAASNVAFNFVPGSPNDPPLRRSNYETRHKLVLSGAWDVADWLTWSMFYIGHAGDPYNYTYEGDVNADGFPSPQASGGGRNNDLVYVPIDANDITLTDPADWDRINAYIEGEECLREQRGQIFERNSCHGPWRNRVDTRFTFKVPTIRGQRGEFIISVFNFLNLLNEDWGRAEGSQFGNIDLLELRGWDTANNRGIFRPFGGVRLTDDGRANPWTVFDPTSRWQAQIGFRYAVGRGGGAPESGT